MTEPEQGKSPENPWPVRAVATRVAKYIDRLGTVWIEGQLTELKVRQSTAFMVLRDPAEVTRGFGLATAPEGVGVYNPAFDVTPAELIAGIITERGVIARPVTAESVRAVVGR